jgi:hypothetical protein
VRFLDPEPDPRGDLDSGERGFALADMPVHVADAEPGAVDLGLEMDGRSRRKVRAILMAVFPAFVVHDRAPAPSAMSVAGRSEVPARRREGRGRGFGKHGNVADRRLRPQRDSARKMKGSVVMPDRHRLAHTIE